MTETNFDYPPSRTLTLEVALEQAEESAAESEDTSDENTRDALAWAVREFGEDAEVILTAYTTRQRSRTVDSYRNNTMGSGAAELSDWLVAAGVDDAPWLDGGENLQTKAEITGQLPPALTDWLDAELDDLNDLSEGN